MYRIRVVPTKSGAKAVQVVRSGGHEIEVIKHIGSTHADEELKSLKVVASNWIEQESPQLSLFEPSKPTTVVAVNHLSLVATPARLIHQLTMKTMELFGFDRLLDQVVLDVVFMRLVEPASKRASLELLETEYGIKHGLATLNRKLKSITKNKTAIEKKAVAYAKTQLGFDFHLVFYDVTTLYFESFKPDTLGQGVRRPGFSKDNKHQQPQIVLGLVVTKEGFPVEFKTFAGNKFEGHTLIPTLKQFQRKHQTDSLTVVADAAMISHKNITALKEEGINYIVGARLANLKQSLIDHIDKTLPRNDQASIRITVEGKGILVCAYSKKRATKGRHETKKQVAKAKQALDHNGTATKRLKFVTQQGTSTLNFNKQLLKKTKQLWGIKGYYTDKTELTNQEIIDHYHNLWQVEKAFRMSKSDLKVRPMYHYKTEHIIAHLLICFMALCVAKHWEKQTEHSVKKVVRLLKNIREAEFKDNITGTTFTIPKQLNPQEKHIVEKLSPLQTN